MAKVADRPDGESQLAVRKLTPKQEAFARAYVETSNASEAYRRCYKANTKPEVVWVKACELLKNGKVAVRVAELKQDLADRHDVTVDYLTAEYRDAIMQGKTLGQIAPVVSAITALGKLHGLISDKVDHNIKHSLGEEFEGFIRSLTRPQSKINYDAETIDG